MKKKSLFGVLVAVALSALGNPGQGAGTVESFGVDFGNAASAAQPPIKPYDKGQWMKELAGWNGI